jgi:aryl-alcohol dehydrogenase-like predicted oxidoreductase
VQYTYFGKTGIQISKLTFGTMTFGGEADEATAAQLFARCREAGINLFDCANIYHGGRSEEILGKLIQNCRQDIILTSKVYFAAGNDINARGLSRRHILQAIEGSLRRLKTDYVDIYFFHRFDEHTPLEESLRTMDDLLRQGKVRYIGASNFAAWQIMKGLGISAKETLAKIICIQPMYNLLKRQAEVELLPMALSENLAVISYNPLAGGLLSGKYSNKQNGHDGRLAINKTYQARYGGVCLQQITDNFVHFANKQGYHPVSLAIAWAAAHPAVTAPLLGARNLAQLEACLDAQSIIMTPDLYQAISAFSPAPPLATDRNDELTADALR